MISLQISVFCIFCNLCSVYSSDFCFNTTSGQCPQQVYSIQKKNITCNCSDTGITCEGTRGLEEIFATLYNQLHHTLRYFDLLVIKDCNSSQLKTNLFEGIKFKTISFKNCKNVEDFSPHIFGGTSDTVEKLNLELIKSQNETAFDAFWKDVFQSIGYLSRLKQLKITNFKSMIIPDFALKSMSAPSLSITHIHFNDGMPGIYSIQIRFEWKENK